MQQCFTTMNRLDDLSTQIEAELDEKDTMREIALKASRTVIRMSGAAVRNIHKGEDPTELIEEAQDEVLRLKSLLRDHKDLYHSGFVEDASQEMVEAMVLHSILNDRPLPGPKDLGVTNSAYLLGMGDVVGELRRSALNKLKTGEVSRAEKYLEHMETIYNFLMRFDYPTGLVAIRRKQDIARSTIEKTRSELTLTIRTKSLEDKIVDLEKKLEK